MKLKRLRRFLEEVEDEYTDMGGEQPDGPDITQIDVHADGKGVTIYTSDGNAHMLAVATGKPKACGAPNPFTTLSG